MFGRLSWFVAGVVAGAIVVIRAFGKNPATGDVRDAAVATGADLLDFTSRLVRPKGTG